MSLYKNKYRVESVRLRGYDYSQAGAYFITICTKNRVCYFGNIDNGKTTLSQIGQIMEQEWFTTPNIRPDMNIEMDTFVVMPDHIHGIIVIYPNRYNRCDVMHHVATETDDTVTKFISPSKNISSIIRGIKSSVTVRARKIDPAFAWQPRFHDHIIRTENELNRIREYIINNPRNWLKDIILPEV